jgi:hypothetical protein
MYFFIDYKICLCPWQYLRILTSLKHNATELHSSSAKATCTALLATQEIAAED